MGPAAAIDPQHPANPESAGAAAANNRQPSDQTAPEAGGPGNDNGPIAIPKKSAPPPPPPPEPTVKNPPGLNNYSLRVDVPVVNVDVGVLAEKTHQFIPNLKEDNFRVFEDGVPQDIVSFHQVKAPITAVLLVEFASNSWNFIFDMWNSACAFTQQLRPDDYVAVVTYDMHTTILTDFTQNKMMIQQAVQSLQMPTWQETNLFDALYETLDRLSRIDGPQIHHSRLLWSRHLLQNHPRQDASRRSKRPPTSPSSPSPPAAPA